MRARPSLIPAPNTALLVWLLAFPTLGTGQPKTYSPPLKACLDSCRSAEESGDYELALHRLERAMEWARKDRDTAAIAHVALKSGVSRQRLGDYDAALSDFYEALLLFEIRNDRNGQAEALNNIGSIHHYDKDFAKAASFYARSLALRERNGTPEERALLLNNIGSLYEDREMPDSALYFLRKALVIRLQQGNTSWLAVTYANMGSCFDRSGIRDSARHFLERSMELVSTTSNKYLFGSINTRLGMALLHAGDAAGAAERCRIGLAASKELRILPLEQRSCECLYQAYWELGRAADALPMFERFVTVRDSMFGMERAKELTRIELTHNFERKQLADSLASAVERHAAIGQERDQKRIFLFGAIGLLLVAGGLWSRLRYIQRSRNIIARERERSDKLLRNILPSSVADELKEHGRSPAREVNDVSILFTDFQGFTRLTEQLPAHELVEGLDTCFRAFDAIAVHHGIEKIKTIGDAYMCAGGLPEWKPDSARDTVLAALDMLDWLEEHNAESRRQGKPAFVMRAGIHTGPVVTGIVGDRKFQYDMWGDTVNIAARMESYGGTGRLNISASTYLLVRDAPGFQFEPRGKVLTKGKGELEMYFVKRDGLHQGSPVVEMEEQKGTSSA